jgi:hypothetical protein
MVDGDVLSLNELSEVLLSKESTLRTIWHGQLISDHHGLNLL